MSDEIITAESLQAGLKAEEGDEQQDKVDSPDENETSKDENLETEVSADDAKEEESEPEQSGDDEATEPPSDTEGSEEEQEESEKSEKPDKPEWFDKRLLRERRKYERKTGELEKRIEQLTANVNQQQAPAYDQNTQIQNPFTGQICDINSVEGQVAIQLTQAAQIQEQAEQQQKTQKAQAELKRKLEKGYGKFEDYEDVIKDSGVTQPMLEAAYLSDNTDELLYNLAKYKPEEIDRISKLSPERQFREMVLLETKMKQSTKKKIVKKVPEPPSKIKGSGQSVKDESDMSFEDLKRHRREAERKRLRM